MSSSFCPFCAHICTFALALILPPLGEACVCHPWSHRDAFAFVLPQGVQAVVSCPWTNEDGLTTGEARRDAFLCTFNIPLSVWREAKPRTSRIGFVQSFDSLSADVHVPPSPRPVRRLVANSGPLHLVFQDLGLLGWRVAPHSVPYTISQVCLASCQPGMSPQSASRGPVERVYAMFPRLWERRCPQRTVDG